MTQKTERPHPDELLTLAFETINNRGHDYDNANDIVDNFKEIAAVASVLVNKDLTPRDVAMVLTVVKLIRSKSNPDKLDNYVDGMNYMAFAACLHGVVPLPPLAAPKKTTPGPATVSDAVRALTDAAKSIDPAA